MNFDPNMLGAYLGVLAVVFAVLLIPIVAIYVLTSYFMAQTFEKMGIQKYLAWVPIRNTWIWLERGGFPGALALLPLVALVDITGGTLGAAANLGFLVVLFLATMNLLPKFGKGKELVVLLLVAPVLFAILGSKNTQYRA